MAVRECLDSGVYIGKQGRHSLDRVQYLEESERLFVRASFVTYRLVERCQRIRFRAALIRGGREGFGIPAS